MMTDLGGKGKRRGIKGLFHFFIGSLGIGDSIVPFWFRLEKVKRTLRCNSPFTEEARSTNKSFVLL